MTITIDSTSPFFNPAQEVVRNGTAVRITSSDYDSVPDGTLGTIKTKYHEARGGVYGITLTEATSAFAQDSTIAFYRNQFEVVTRTETTVEDLVVGDEVRMVFPEGGSAYWDTFGQVGTVTELPDGFMQGLVDVNFGGRSVICYAWRLEVVEQNETARWERAERELVEADPGFEVGDRVRVIKGPVSVDAPLDVIEDVEVGTIHTIEDVFGDGDYKVIVDDETHWVAGACLRLDTSPRVGDVIESVGQLEGLDLCAVVTNQYGAPFIKITPTSTAPSDRKDWISWTGNEYTSKVVRSMGTLTVLSTGATA